MKKHIIWSNMNLDIKDWRDDYKDKCLEDERWNLDKVVDGRILVVADLGLWNGRRSVYKIIDSGNIQDILSFTYDYVEFYGDGYNIRGTEVHHDGTNYYLYRVIREDRNIDNLLSAIYNGEEITSSKLNYYTKSLYKPVAEVYGWR